MFSIGDEKEIVRNGTIGDTVFSNVTMSAFILGFNHNHTVEGENLTHFCIGKKDGKLAALVDKYYGTDALSVNGFDSNTVLLERGPYESPGSYTLLLALPDELQSVMIQFTKKTWNFSQRIFVSQTQRLHLPSVYEITGHRESSSFSENKLQGQYEYFKNKSSGDMIFYKYNATNEACNIWTRTTYTQSYQCYITQSGSHNETGNTSYSYGYTPIFAVGGATA